MNGAALFWLILYGCAVTLFFGAAAAITVLGIRDLRDLLKHSTQKK